MSISAKYVHTNLIAHDWRKLADFYINVFGCVPVPPERDLFGENMERLTGLENAHLRGTHLRLPGFGDAGPTLEIFQYTQMPDKPPTAVNRPGFGHIAFLVDDVEAACAAVQRAGGAMVGEVVEMPIAGRTFVGAYLTDLEGNIIELQAWR